MVAKYLLPALAVAGSVAAQNSCTFTSTMTISSAAQATAISGCRTVSGSIEIVPGAGETVDISGPARITGDLRVVDNDQILSLRGDDLATVDGAFFMNNVTKLATLQLPSLTKVKTLSWTTLNNLDAVSIGPPGLSQAEEITIADTFLSTLDGIDVVSTRKININNNRRLEEYTTRLGNLSDVLNIAANGLNLSVSMPNLIWIANMTIANVTSFSAPSLQTINGSARFDFNYFPTFNAPNLTSTRSGDISFVGNSNLNNISFPVLTSIGGGLLIANNTDLEEINGFPKLKTVGGAVKLKGSFTDVSFPSLNDVKGAFDMSSTEDISASCERLKELAPARSGGGGQIQGTYNCESNDADANQDTGSGTTDGGDGDEDAAAGVILNTALLSVAAVVGIAQAFL